MKIKTKLFIFLSILPITLAASEEPDYKVLLTSENIEIRHYEKMIVAEVFVEGKRGDAGNKAFSPLLKYITGKNMADQKIPMTAPVRQEKPSSSSNTSSEKEAWLVSFVMPNDFVLEDTPLPNNSDIKIKELSEKTMAVIRYSGSWSNKNYEKHSFILNTWLEENKISVEGSPVWARYNAPFIPTFLRRNEIQIPVIYPEG